MHPSISNVVSMFSSFADNNPDSKVEIVTNGFGRRVKEEMSKVPHNIFVKNTAKEGRYQKKFEPFNIAPCDSPFVKLSDFTNACWVTEYCGIGLNPYGYYHCGVAGAIDRVIGSDIGKKSMPIEHIDFHNMKTHLCRVCGHFLNRRYLKPEQRNPVDGEPMSLTWKTAYDQFSRTKPQLQRY